MEEFTNVKAFNTESTLNEAIEHTQPAQEEMPARLPKNKDHLIAGIIITAFFNVFGLPVLINACKARLRWRHKNYELALASAKKSGRWIAPSIIIGVLFLTALIALYVWFIIEFSDGMQNYYEPSSYNF
ncbi:MAG: CD225/dispanin family protein [Bacteroidales bacterium]|nr:CD225/dispanin family protein [Bacteroidales bacterium]